MKIGLSLPPDYLAGHPEVSSAATVWHSAFGPATACLEALRKAGVTSIELRSVAEDAHPNLTLCAAQRVWDAELSLTVHGRLPRPILGETLAEIYPSLVPLTKALRRRCYESILTLHCYSAQRGDIRELAERTVRALRKMLDVFRNEQVPLHIALEINHISARIDPGVTYAGILNMIARADSPRIGACWDLGHAFMNVQHGQLERIPSDTFLKSVIHTHVHDLGPRTHFPLTCNVVPLDLFLDLLLAQGYSGVLNLELSPDRFQGPVLQLIYASIERLAEYDRRRVDAGERVNNKCKRTK